MSKVLKCACYARVSTDDQGSSIVNQHDYFDQFIKKNGWVLYDIYTDEALSGTKSHKRLAYQRMIEDGKNKRYDVLLSKSFTRFGRNQRETLTIISELRGLGIRVVFTENNLDSEIDSTKFGLFAWLAEQEAATTSDRLKLIWQHYNETGKVHVCLPPYGYEYDEKIKNFVINNGEASIVKQIFQLYVQGNGLDKIARILTLDDVPTKRGGKWAGATIRGIISNQFYLGSLVQGKSKGIDVTMTERSKIDKEDWFIHENNHDAIVSLDTFQNVQDQLNERSRKASNFTRTRQSNSSLFSNLIRCGECGSAFTVKRQKHFKNYAEYYTCINYELKGSKIAGHSRIAVYENVLIAAVRSDLLTWKENNYEKIKALIKGKLDAPKPININTALATVNKKIGELTKLSLSLLMARQDGMIGDTQFKLQNESIEANLGELMKKKDEYVFVQKQTLENMDTSSLENDIKKKMDAIINMDISEWTNALMKCVVSGITVSKDANIVVEYTFQNTKSRYLLVNDLGTLESLIEWVNSL